MSQRAFLKADTSSHREKKHLRDENVPVSMTHSDSVLQLTRFCFPAAPAKDIEAAFQSNGENPPPHPPTRVEFRSETLKSEVESQQFKSSSS